MSGSDDMGERTFDEIIAERGRTFRNAAEAYRHLTGKTLSDEDAAERLWYHGLRNRMVAARKASGKSQGAIAGDMGTSQSEVSRLENSLSAGTRLGTLRSYLTAIGSSLEALLLPEAPTGAPVRDDAGDPGMRMRIVIEGEEFIGMEAVGIRDSLQAMANLLNRSGIDPEQRMDVILGFLHELSRVRETSIPNARRGFDVRIEMTEQSHDPVIGTVQKRSSGSTLSDVEFRKFLAEPLNLVL